MASKILIRNVPDDIHEFILQEQVRLKIRKKCNGISVGTTIVRMLRDYKKCQDSNNFTPDERD